MQWISFLNDVISLFFLPQCVVCHPAKCFCNVTTSKQRTHYGNYDSLTTVLQVTSETGICGCLCLLFPGMAPQGRLPTRQETTNQKQNSTRIGGPVLDDSNNSKT